MANGTKELSTSPITIEDEISEFSEKPVKGKTLYKKLKELEDGTLPDTAAASAGDVLTLDEDKKPTWAPPSGGGNEWTPAFTLNVTNNYTKFDKTLAEIGALNPELGTKVAIVTDGYTERMIVTGMQLSGTTLIEISFTSDLQSPDFEIKQVVHSNDKCIIEYFNPAQGQAARPYTYVYNGTISYTEYPEAIIMSLDKTN